MKKYAFLVAAAAMGFTACSKDEVAEIKNEPSFKLTVEASADETRSSFGDKDETAGYLSNWSGAEEVWFYMGEDHAGVKATPAAAGASTTFDVTFTGTAPASGTIYALSPVGDYNHTPQKGGFTSNSLTTSHSYSYVVIPSEQTPLDGSCDETVHLLAAAKEFTGSIESPLKMKFNHVAAYGKMTITGFSGTIASVTITSPVAVVGASCHYYYKTDVLSGASGNSITLKADNVTDNVFWFGCAPASLTSGTMTVAVTDTDGKRYVKEIALTADKGIDLQQGRIAAFSVNMEGIAAEEVPAQIIADGDYVIAVESKNAMMTVGTPSQTYRGYRDLPTTMVDNKLAVDEDAIWTINYTANKGYTIKSYSENTYLYWDSTNKNNASLTSSEHYVNINAVDGGYNIVASTALDRLLAYNVGSRFAFYGSSFTSGQKVLQIIPAYVDTTPVISVDHTELNIPAAGTAGMNITVTTKNFGYYTVTASSDNAQFVTLVSGDVVTVTATANENETAIEGTITITVTDSTNTLTADVAVSQAAKGTSTPKYVKVTSAPTDWSGTYLIVYEASETEGRIFTGVVGDHNNLQATIDNGTIDVTNEIKALEIEIAHMTGGYSLKCPSGYMYGTSDTNVVSFNTTTAQLNTIEYNTTDKCTKITSNTSVFRFNSNAQQMRFRYFKSTSYTSQSKVQLYKLEN